jgi:hypothetical protein
MCCLCELPHAAGLKASHEPARFSLQRKRGNAAQDEARHEYGEPDPDAPKLITLQHATTHLRTKLR